MKKRYYLFSYIVVFTFALFYLKGELILADDTIFHLNRLTSLSGAIYNRDFFPEVFFQQNFNYGYGSPLFYSTFFLIPFSILKFYVSTVKVFVLLQALILTISFITASLLASYLSKKPAAILTSSLLYAFAPYHITTIVLRSALGESMAIAILPIVLLGFIKFIENENIVTLIIGITLLSLAHNLSFIVMLFFLCLLTLINLKKIKVKSILKLVVAVVFVIGLSSFYTMPLIEALQVVKVVPYDFDYYSQLLDIKSLFGFATIANVNINMYLSIGIVSFTLMLFSIYFNRTKFNLTYVILALITLFMTTIYFPKIFMTPFEFLQFPWRLIAFASLLSIIPITITLDNLYFKIDIFILFLFIIRIFSFNIYSDLKMVEDSWVDDQLRNDNIVTTYGESLGFNSSEVAMAEYINNPWVYNYRLSDYAVFSSSNEYQISNIDYDKIEWTLNLEKDESLQVPRIYYPGYKLYIDGKNTAISFNESQLITVIGLKGEHKYQLVFEGSIIQKVSGYLSILTLIIFLYLIKVKKIK